MKKLFLCLIAANLLVDIASYFLLPDNVATHFGSGGTPNGWFSPGSNLVFNLGLQALFVLIVVAMNTGLTKVPKAAVNLPNKHYWLTERHLPEFKKRWNTLTYQFGCGLMAFFLVISLIILDANFSNPIQLNTRVFVTAMIGFLLFIVYWIFSLHRTFRVPQ